VGALDTHNLEQHEYMDRSRAYSKRIESGRIKFPEGASCLLKDIPAPERTLAADPLAIEDQELVNTLLHLSRIFFVMSTKFVNNESNTYIKCTDYRNAQQGCDSIRRCKSRTQGGFGGSISIVIVEYLSN